MPSGDARSDHVIVSYAVKAEDVLLSRAFADRRAGFFVDVGAGDPVSGSVTKNLVDRLDWRGVNIEPQPEWFARLRSLRPNDVNLEVAVDRQPGTATFYQVLDAPDAPVRVGLSTLDPSIARTHRSTGWWVREFTVEVVTLQEVLARHAEPGFDLLKIDVEGREAAVLASVDLAEWRPRVLMAEAILPTSAEPSHHEWEGAVLGAGYELAQFDGLNRFYARADEPDLLRRLSVPVEALDGWIRVADQRGDAVSD